MGDQYATENVVHVSGGKAIAANQNDKTEVPIVEHGLQRLKHLTWVSPAISLLPLQLREVEI